MEFCGQGYLIVDQVKISSRVRLRLTYIVQQFFVDATTLRETTNISAIEIFPFSTFHSPHPTSFVVHFPILTFGHTTIQLSPHFCGLWFKIFEPSSSSVHMQL
jgi:hypothetical protein